MQPTASILTQRAAALGLPIAKNAFEGTLENPVPKLPYLVYSIPHQSNASADTVFNLVSQDWNLELYTAGDDEKTSEITKRIESEILHDVNFEKYTAYIDSEECYQIAYQIKGLLRKIKEKI